MQLLDSLLCQLHLPLTGIHRRIGFVAELTGFIAVFFIAQSPLTAA